MKVLNNLAFILWVAWLIVAPINALAMGNDTGDGFNIQVNIYRNDDTGSINVLADWNDIEGATSYKVWVDQADYIADNSSFSINVGIGGDFTFFVAAYDASGAEIRKSNEFTVKLPSANAQYVGKGKISMRSEFNEVANSQRWTGSESGSVNILVYKETVKNEDGSQSTNYKAYGTGKAGFGSEVRAIGDGISYLISGEGTLSVQGFLYGDVVKPDQTPCIMILTLSTSYPSVKIHAFWGGYDDTIYQSWNTQYAVAGMQIQDPASYSVVDLYFGAIPRTVYFIFESVSFTEPELSTCLH